jgi:hypothetical protein
MYSWPFADSNFGTYDWVQHRITTRLEARQRQAHGNCAALSRSSPPEGRDRSPHDLYGRLPKPLQCRRGRLPHQEWERMAG